jgi:hypothetical protein
MWGVLFSYVFAHDRAIVDHEPYLSYHATSTALGLFPLTSHLDLCSFGDLSIS